MKLEENKKNEAINNTVFDENKKSNGYIRDIFSQKSVKNIFIVVMLVMLVFFIFINIGKIFNFFETIISILNPIIIGWIFTFIFSPLYNFVIKRINSKNNEKLTKFSKLIATIICCIVILLFTIGIIFLFVPQLISSITRFFSKFSNYISSVRETIDSFQDNSHNDIVRQIFDQIENSLLEVRDNYSYLNYKNYNAIVGSIFTGFAVSFKAILNCFIGFIVMIYSLNMKEELLSSLKKVLFALTKKEVGEKVLKELKFAKQVFEGFFIGKVLDSLIIAGICYIFCLIMGMPYTPLIAVIIGITNLIPFFGPFVGAIPTFLLVLLEETFTWKPFIFIIFIVVLQQIDGNIIGPKVLGDRTGVGSFWVLFSIILFGGLYGLVGMIIAVPLWAVFTRIFDEFINTKLKKKNYPTDTLFYKNINESNNLLGNNHNV